MGESGSSLSWENIWGDYGKKSTEEQKRKESWRGELENKYRQMMTGELPSEVTAPLAEKYGKLAEQQGSYLAGQFGSSGMGNTGIYQNQAYDLQKSLGQDYTSALASLAFGQQQAGMQGLAGLYGQPNEYYQPNPSDALGLLGMFI